MSLSSTYAEDKGVDLLLLDQDLEQIAAASQAYRDKQLVRDTAGRAAGNVARVVTLWLCQ